MDNSNNDTDDTDDTDDTEASKEGAVFEDLFKAVFDDGPMVPIFGRNSVTPSGFIGSISGFSFAGSMSGRFTSHQSNMRSVPKLNTAALGSLDKLMNHAFSHTKHLEAFMRPGSYLVFIDGQSTSDAHIRLDSDNMHEQDWKLLNEADDFSIVAAYFDHVPENDVILVPTSLHLPHTRTCLTNIIKANPQRDTCNYIPMFIEHSRNGISSFRYIYNNQEHDIRAEHLQARTRFHELVDEMRAEVIINLCE